VPLKLQRSPGSPWSDPGFWPGLTAATAELDPPYGVIFLPALAHNAFDMLDRATGTPIRVASKSVRVRAVLDAVLALPGYHGVLAYTLPEALWLAETIEDVVVGYPTVDREAIRALASDPRAAARVTLMVDSTEHLDLIDAVAPPKRRETIRVAVELDASFSSAVLGRIGVWRSPVSTPREAAALARTIVDRPGFALVGLMAYESQLAGVGDRPPGRPVRRSLVETMQRGSRRELLERRAAVVAAVRNVTELEFVNGGGTGSIEYTAADPSVTEVAAGSGLFGPHLFDTYSGFSPAPAASFALSVVRKPRPDIATLMGGGWIASGPAGWDRSPEIAWPTGLKYIPREGAGEVQTPLRGSSARGLGIGDRVWLRHTKAGEISEHVNDFSVVDDGRVVDTVPTYRGEGKAFL
jgi:D-serine deaminase-like pyridoxal phosphate-dependent protein